MLILIIRSGMQSCYHVEWAAYYVSMLKVVFSLLIIKFDVEVFYKLFVYLINCLKVFAGI